MRRVHCIVCMICFFFSIESKGQDIHFSQFYENAILRNPALTGIFSGDYKVGANYRNQWSSVDAHPFTTALASFESRIHVNQNVPDFLSFGLTTVYDKSGSIDFTTLQAYAAVNYNKFLEDQHNTFLSAGFTGGYIQRSFDLSKMTFANQYVNGSYSPNNPTREKLSFNNVSNFDFGFGLSLNGSLGAANRHNYYAGAAAYHVTKPSLSFRDQGQLVRLSTKYIVSIGMRFSITDVYSITGHLNYVTQNPYREIVVGTLISWKNYDINTERNIILYGGVFYRYQDAIIPTFKVDFNKYSLTLSYDINNSTARKATNGFGGFEISLFYRGVLAKNDYSSMVRCPKFEDVNMPF